MLEAKRGQIVIIKCPKFPELEGIISAVESDRLEIYYSKDYESYAWALSEGDEIFVKVHTQFGIKPMNSMVICSPSGDGKLVIENAKALGIYQKREFVRAAIDFRFFIKKLKKGQLASGEIHLKLLLNSQTVHKFSLSLKHTANGN